MRGEIEDMRRELKKREEKWREEIIRDGEERGKGKGNNVGKARERRTKEGGINEKEQPEGQERKNYGGLNVEREKNEMEIRRVNEEGGERREESEDRLWMDKDWERLVEVGGKEEVLRDEEGRKGEIEDMRRELKEREVKWREEREEMRGRLEDMERRILEEKREEKERAEKGGEGTRGECREKDMRVGKEDRDEGERREKEKYPNKKDGGKGGEEEGDDGGDHEKDRSGGDRLVEEEVERMRIGDKVDSDHHPIEIWIREEVRMRGGRKGEKGDGRVVWDEEGRRIFKRKMKELMEEERGEGEGWEEVREAMREAERSGGEEERNRGLVG
ncbi:hypothetical protein EAG_05382 [Camponotus floridanus]|uniref:Uncharacterized protein n=1 Tax=Camponotus floridanus TaxID=104421 RepID=E2AT74_CAMFO|nr:hypothetical protein EAG_05382 [Camponotus floridanus]